MENVRAGAFARDGRIWRDHLSSKARDLITRMLEVDPDRRITAQQALEHPFFRMGVQAEVGSTEGAAATTRENEVAAMRSVLIARTSQHLKAMQSRRTPEEQASAASGDYGTSRGGGIGEWFSSFWK